MSTPSSYARGLHDLEALAPIVSWAFGSSPTDSLVWLQTPGSSRVRVLSSKGDVKAGLVEIPMGQYFGGASVPCLGIAGVAVAAESRGRGLAKQVMRDALSEARARGVELSALYPASLTLYRGVGYELGGCRYRYVAELHQLPQLPPTLELSFLEPSRYAECETIYRDLARENPGFLDRSDYIWRRVRTPQGQPVRGVMLQGAQGPEGYAYLVQQTRPAGYDLHVTDWVARTPEAARAFLSYLGQHRSTAGEVSWYGGTSEPRLFAFPERVFKVSLTDYWMLRLVHVERALCARGYPELTADLDLHVEDATLPENTGRYRLCIEAGQPNVIRTSGQGRVRLTVGALASLYSGFASATQLARAGLLQADSGSLAPLDALFAGAAPGMADYF